MHLVFFLTFKPSQGAMLALFHITIIDIKTWNIKIWDLPIPWALQCNIMKEIVWLDPREITRNLELQLLKITELMKEEKHLCSFFLVKNPVRNWHFFIACSWEEILLSRGEDMFYLFIYFWMNSSGMSMLTYTSHNASGNSPVILLKFLESFSSGWIKTFVFGSDSPSVWTGPSLIQSVKLYNFTSA